MLLGLRSKNKKHATVRVDYAVHVQEVKPWPAPLPEAKKPPRSVLIQWANGDRNSGSTRAVPPSPGAGDEEDKVEFNESFKIEVKLTKGHGSSGFQKNLLELSLYEVKGSKNSKGQHLGIATVDLADYGVIKEAVTVAAPVVGKKSSKNAAQPVVYLKIQPFDGSELSGSSVSALMNEEYAEEEETEIASFTDDDDLSSHSSLANSHSVDLNADVADQNTKAEQQHENISELKSDPMKEGFEESAILSDVNSVAVGQNGSTKSEDGVDKDVKNQEVQERQIEARSAIDSPDNLSVALDATVKQASENTLKTLFPSDFNTSNRRSRLPGRVFSTLTGDRTRNIRFSMRPIRARNDHYEEDVKEIVIQKDAQNGGTKPATEAGKDDQERMSLSEDKPPIRISRNEISNNRIRDLELRVELLEGELREAAAIEISLYSIIAEHGSSAHKVHSPARRLSRLYIHALKHWSKERRANSARSAASGLVLAAKSCGNDVPRLTFWLSNSVMLRAIITQTTKEPEVAKKDANDSVENGSKTAPAPAKKYSPLKWETVRRKKGKLGLTEHFNEWEEAKTFIDALQKIETWIFSRVVESVWWQTFTPHMQSASESSSRKSHVKKIYGKQQIVGDQQQANLSIEIWKRAFKDASERLCPVRAGGHDCGCLPILARSVMEQCVARLDVAMFNAILRESDDGIPTDPMSDPITELKVLPVPSGKSSFGAGAQLKNAIGNWARKLADLFGMDEELPEDENIQKDDKVEVAESVKPFYLLNALSDLLMLPKDMLLERTIRKEVCPAFSSAIIKQILDGFLPDEFCPDPIPDNVLEALESEDHLESTEKGIRNIPCNASPMIYSPPSVTSVERVIGNIQTRNLKGGSSMVRKSYTSDDELVELDSPLASITDMFSNPIAKLKESNKSHAIRYQLLHEVWRGDN